MHRPKRRPKLDTERFKGLDEKLSIAWDRDPSGVQTGIKRPFSAAHGMGKMIILIPLSCSLTGEYVMVEQQPSAFEGELANRHYRIEEPKEITLPFDA